MIDPTTKRVTHLVVKAQREPWVERLPVELVDPGEVRSLPAVQEVAYLQLGDFPDVTIPIGAVAKVETDDVTLSLMKDQGGSFPRWLFGAGRLRAGTDDDQRVRFLAERTATRPL